MKVKFLWIGVVVLFMAGLFTTISDAVIDPDTIVGLWGFDDGDGDTARDSSNNENDGILVSNPKWVEGRFGYALEFDGEAYVNMGNAESLQFDGDVTIVFWAKPKNVGIGRQNIICKSYGGEGCLTQEVNGSISFFWGDCGGNCEPFVRVAKPPAGTIVSGEWIHIAEVRDVSTRQYRMYKNGEVASEGTWNVCGEQPCGDSTASNLNLYIGHGYAGKFRGILDEVAIIGAVLSEDDIKNVMDNGFEGVAAVSVTGKLTTTWAKIKR